MDDADSDEEFNPNDDEVANFDAPVSSRRVWSDAAVLDTNAEGCIVWKDSNAAASGTAFSGINVVMRSLRTSRGSFGKNAIVADTTIETAHSECRYAQELHDLANLRLISLQRGNTGHDYPLAELVRGGRVNADIDANKKEDPALHALARALRKAGVLTARIQVYFGEGRTDLHFDSPFDSMRLLVKMSGECVWYETKSSDPTVLDSIGHAAKRQLSAILADSNTFAKGKLYRGSPPTNVNPHSSKPRPDGQISTSIICQVPRTTNGKETMKKMVEALAELQQIVTALPLRPEFATPAAATNTLMTALPQMQIDLQQWGKGGWNKVAVKVYAVDKEDTVFQYLRSETFAAEAIGVGNDVISKRLLGIISMTSIRGSLLQNVSVERVDSSVDVQFVSSSVATEYFAARGYSTPDDVVQQILAGCHPNSREGLVQPDPCCIRCTETNEILTAHSSTCHVGLDLYGESYGTVAEQFGKIVLRTSCLTRPNTVEFHPNRLAPHKRPCELFNCFLSKLDSEEDLKACRDAGLFELSGEEKKQALINAGKWNANAKANLTCGCGRECSNLKGIHSHIGRCTNEGRKGYWRLCGVKAFSGAKYRHLQKHPN